MLIPFLLILVGSCLISAGLLVGRGAAAWRHRAYRTRQWRLSTQQKSGDPL
jgi:hypothetical protein